MEFLQMLESIRGELLTTLNLVVTKFGEELILFSIICLIYWCIDKNLGYRIAFSFMIAGVIVNIIKISLKIPRPFSGNSAITPVDKALKHASGYSFPSGHTQSATSVYGSVALALRKKSTLLLLLFFLPIIAIGFSRMYLGVHTPVDVLTGFVIGFIINIIMCHLFENYVLDKSHHGIIFIGGIVLSFAIMIFGLYQITYNNADPAAGMACVEIGSAALGFIIGWYIEISYVRFCANAVDWKFQILKYILGMMGLAFFYIIPEKALLLFLEENNIIINIVPNFLVTLWVTGIYPFVIKKLFSSPYAYR